MRPVQRVRFRAMGGPAEVAVVGGPGGLAERGQALVAALEERWSRFRPASELTRLNHAGGRPVAVHPDTVRLVQAMVAGWHLTGGAYDPTLLVPLVGLGYASSRCDPSAWTALPVGARRSGRPDEVLVDERAAVVVVPPGTVLDPGGIGKGLAADLVAERLLEAGAGGVLVELGGDLRVGGESPEPGGWLVAVGDDDETRPLRLADGGVATSGTGRTRWVHGEGEVHHVLDPRCGLPVGEGAGDPVEATVATGTAAWAEVLATAALVRGVAWAGRELGRLGLAGLLRTGDGRRHAMGRWSELVDPVRDGEEAA